MFADRITLLIIALVAVFLARDPNSSVFNIVSFAWAGFGAVFGPVVLFALFWKRSNWQGALAGMISGGAMVFIWKYLVRPLGGAWDIIPLKYGEKAVITNSYLPGRYSIKYSFNPCIF